MGQVPGKPSLTPAEQADLLPPSKPPPATNLLPPGVELPPGIKEATSTWIAPAAEPPPIAKPEARIAGSPPLVVNVIKPATPRLTPEEREQFRLWKNVIVFGFLVAVLVLVFWVLAR